MNRRYGVLNRFWRSVLPVLAALLLLSVVAGGCGRIPKIVVLEDPLTAAEHVDLGVAYERKGELALAQREYERALRKERGHFQARVNLGNVFLAKKEYEKAREEYLLALEVRPGDAEATNNLAWCAILSGEGIGEALSRMETVVSAPGGGRPEFLDTLGVLRTRANLPGPAADAFSLAEDLCREAGGASGAGGGSGASGPGQAACTEEIQKEIREHREELRRRFPPPSTPPLIK